MADYPTRIPSDALTGEFVPEIWSAKVLDHVKSNLVCTQVVNTSWVEELKKGDKLWIPLLGALTAYIVDTGDTVFGRSEVNTAIGDTDVFINIDKWYDCAVQIDDSVKIQTQVSGLLERVTTNAAYAIEKVIDTDVHELFDTLAAGSIYGSDGQTFNDDIMIALMEYLDEGDVPRTDRSLVIDPSTIADIYKIDKFVRLDYQKVAVSATGNIGQIYGVPTFVTNNLEDYGTGNIGALLHKDAIGLAIQQNMVVEKWREPARHSDMVTVSALWGADLLRSTFGKGFYTRSAGV